MKNLVKNFNSFMFEKFNKSECCGSAIKAAEEKYPKRSAKEMKKTLGKMKASDFKQKAKKYFGWADDPEAAAAAFIRKATKKEPKDV